MPTYQPISIAAQNLNTTEDELLALEHKNWISTVERNGGVFVSRQEQYKVRFILLLRTNLRLTEEEIDLVMEMQRPPYSLQEVPKIIGRKLGTAGS